MKTVHVMSAHILVPVQRVKYTVDPGTKFWSMALQDDLQCPRGERKIFRAFPGDSSWDGVKLLGKRGGSSWVGRGRQRTEQHRDLLESLAKMG